MRRPKRHIQKERRIIGVVCTVVDVLDRLASQSRQHVDFIIELDDFIIFDHTFHIASMMKSMKVIKTPVDGPIGNLAADGG